MSIIHRVFNVIVLGQCPIVVDGGNVVLKFNFYIHLVVNVTLFYDVLVVGVSGSSGKVKSDFEIGDGASEHCEFLIHSIIGNDGKSCFVLIPIGVNHRIGYVPASHYKLASDKGTIGIVSRTTSHINIGIHKRTSICGKIRVVVPIYGTTGKIGTRNCQKGAGVNPDTGVGNVRVRNGDVIVGRDDNNGITEDAVRDCDVPSVVAGESIFVTNIAVRFKRTKSEIVARSTNGRVDYHLNGNGGVNQA